MHMNDMPLVSIILPCYNVEQYISKVYRSIYDSSYSKIEIIFVDDGSIDSTVDEINRIKDPRVRLIKKANGGVSSARNVGIREALGKYILFIDPDDTIDSSLIEKSVKKIEEKKADILTFGFELIKIEDNKSKLYYPVDNYEIQGTKEIIETFMPRLIGISRDSVIDWQNGGDLHKNKEWGTVWRFLFKREIICENDIFFDEKLPLNEDMIFICKYLCCVESITTLYECLYKYGYKQSGAMLTNINSNRVLKNKIALANARLEITEIIKERFLINIEDWYAGSLVLSIFEIFYQMSKEKNKGCAYADSLLYIQRKEVLIAIRCTPLGKKIKFSIPLLLLKLHMYRVLFYIFVLLNMLNIKISM